MTCQNCGTEMVGAWCHACGQKRMDLRTSFLHLLAEFGRETFEVDGRVPRTLFALVVKPGALTEAFMAGRRASFTPPFRLYLACSLMWLSVASVLSVAQDWSGEAIAGVELHVSRDGEGPGDFRFDLISSDVDAEGVADEVDEAESFENARQAVLHLRTSWMEATEAEAYAASDQWQLVEARMASNWEANQGTHSGTWWLARVVPGSTILTLPWLAGLLWFVHGPRRAGGAIEGLLAALHLNAYGFVVFSVFFAAMKLPDPLGEVLQIAGLVSLPVHLYVLMWRVWDRGWWGTLWRWLLLGVLYLLVFFIVVALHIVYGTLLG